MTPREEETKPAEDEVYYSLGHTRADDSSALNGFGVAVILGAILGAIIGAPLGLLGGILAFITIPIFATIGAIVGATISGVIVFGFNSFVSAFLMRKEK